VERSLLKFVRVVSISPVNGNVNFVAFYLCLGFSNRDNIACIKILRHFHCTLSIRTVAIAVNALWKYCNIVHCLIWIVIIGPVIFLQFECCFLLKVLTVYFDNNRESQDSMSV